MVAGNQKIEAEERSDRIAMLSTFPPTPCGIATFAAALSSGLEEAGASVTRVDVTKTLTSGPEGEVSTLGLRQTVAALNSCDAVIVQHEYGIYPGPFGASILDIVDGVDVPVIVVAHTVPNEPLPQQRRILTKLCRTVCSAPARGSNGPSRPWRHLSTSTPAGVHDRRCHTSEHRRT